MKDIAALVRQKLRNLAWERQEDFDYVLRQYVVQRLLYRLGCSAYTDQPGRVHVMHHKQILISVKPVKIGRVKHLCF
ncbi:MAG: hypothetical protein L3J84_05710 [Gammaproteobacteria bacterium]|nr:hypothetical protein [Gammaproteobacteria bacterium]